MGVDHVGVPDVRSRPTQVLGQFDRCLAEGLSTVFFLVAGLGEMGVGVDAVGAGELGALAHQVR
jgi:hypothetical protein